MSYQIKDENNNSVVYSNRFFHAGDFKNKKIIFLLSKTWGAARVFYFKTALCKFKNVRIEFLHNKKQLQLEKPNEVIVIKLDRALEEDDNRKLWELAVEKRIKILDYEIPTGD